MLNYIGAECYKLCRKKSLFIGMAVLLVLESLVFLPMLSGEEVGRGLAYLFLLMMLPIGLLVAPVFASLTVDDQYRNGTLKNEIIFGIPRSRVYLGKLAAAILVGTAAAAVTVGWSLLLCQLCCTPEGTLELPLTQVLFHVACTLPLWIGALSFSFLLLMLLRSASGAMALTYLICVFGTPVALVGCGEDSSLALRLFDTLFYAAPFRALYADQSGLRFWNLSGGLTWLSCWGLGLGWVVVTSAIGLAVFRRREIR